jgi:hypothetical protein
VFFCACNQQQKREPVDCFNEIKHITEYDTIYSDINDEIVGMMALDKYEKYLIAYNRITDYFFSFYDIEKGVYLGSWGRRGQGPDEFTDAGRMVIADTQIVFTDGSKKEIIYAPIERILNKE